MICIWFDVVDILRCAHFIKGTRAQKIKHIRKIIGVTSTTSTPTTPQAGWDRQTESPKYDEHWLSCPAHPATIIISGGKT